MSHRFPFPWAARLDTNRVHLRPEVDVYERVKLSEKLMSFLHNLVKPVKIKFFIYKY